MAEHQPSTSQVSGQGVAEFKDGRYQLTSLLNLPTGQVSYDEVVVGDVVFERGPNKKGAPVAGWRRRLISAVELPLLVPYIGLTGDSNAPGKGLDLAARRLLVDACLSGIQRLGNDILHSVPTQHYRVNLDFNQAAKRVSNATSLPRNGVIQVDIWIDESGGPRKVVTSDGLAYEIWDPNLPVSITPPQG